MIRVCAISAAPASAQIRRGWGVVRHQLKEGEIEPAAECHPDPMQHARRPDATPFVQPDRAVLSASIPATIPCLPMPLLRLP